MKSFSVGVVNRRVVMTPFYFFAEFFCTHIFILNLLR